MALKEFTVPDYAKMERRRINKNPKRSLEVLAELKANDYFEFGITRQELARELLARALAAMPHDNWK